MPIAGRTFRPSDAEPGAPPVIVMGEGLWRSRFSADPSLIGRQVRLNGSPFTVIGVVRDDVQLRRPASIWSLSIPAPNLPRALRYVQVVGRLKPGVTIESTQADLAVVADRLARTYPETNKDWSVTVEPLRTGVMGPALRRGDRSCSPGAAGDTCRSCRYVPERIEVSTMPAARQLANQPGIEFGGGNRPAAAHR